MNPKEHISKLLLIAMKSPLTLFLLGLTILSGCQSQDDNLKNLEVRKINKDITAEQKAALNFLAVNMDPYEEAGFINKAGDFYTKVYFYFDISDAKAQIVIKREAFFDNSMPKQVLTSNELRSVEYVIWPIESLSAENINVGQGELDNQKVMDDYHIEMETLYKSPIQKIVKWYSTSKEMGKNKVEKIDKVETSNSMIGFNDYQKASQFASQLKILSGIK